jgi:FolB domain-containing protein
MDHIGLRDLELSCIIGVSDDERSEPTCIHANIALTVNTLKAGWSDLLEETVDYAELEARLVAAAAASRFRLMEALAELLAAECLTYAMVEQVEVELEKRGVLRHSRAAVVRVRRTREHSIGTCSAERRR